MNVAFIRETTNGAFTFLKNDFSEGHRRIYNNCPDNIFTFLTMYREKYGKFPTGNVTASYYQKSATAGADPELIITSQGASEVSFVETETVTDIISKQFFEEYSKAELDKSFDVMLDYKFNPANLNISAADIAGGQEGGSSVEGSVAIVTADQSEAVATTTKWFAILPDTTYTMGYITVSEKKAGAAIEASAILDRCFCTFQLKVEEGKVTGITCTKKADTQEKTLSLKGIDGLNIAGYVGDEIQHISGLQIVSNHTAGSTFNFTEGALHDITNKLRYQFDIDLNPGTTQEDMYKVQFVKYEEDVPYTYDSGTPTEFVVGTTKLHNVCMEKVPDKGATPPTQFSDKYMYLDPSLHLPDIYMQPSDEILFDEVVAIPAGKVELKK